MRPSRFPSLFLLAGMCLATMLTLAGSSHAVPTSNGTITVSRTLITCNDSVGVQVEDLDLSGRGTISVVADSDADLGGITVTLTETAGVLGQFTGTLVTTSDPQGIGLLVQSNNQVRISYIDANDGAGGLNLIKRATLRTDCLAPVFSSISLQPVGVDGVVVQWATSEPSTSYVLYGTSNPPTQVYESSTLKVSHSFTINGLGECATLYLAVGGEDALGNRGNNDNGGAYFRFTTPEAAVRFSENMGGGNPGWEVSGGWAFGVPTGGGGSTVAGGSGGPDPTSGADGPNVYGYNLTGNYEAGLVERQFLTTPSFDCRGSYSTKLEFSRWLCVERTPYDKAGIQVSNDGGRSWTTVWTNSTSNINDRNWTHVSYDISRVADDKEQVRVRWYMGTTDSTENFCGWNIDNVRVLSYLPCGAPNLQVVGAVIDDSTTGNGNGRLDYNETVLVTVRLANYGGEASNVQATVTSSMQGVSVLEGSLGFGTVAADSEKTAITGRLLVKASASTQTIGEIGLTLNGSSDLGSFIGRIPLTVWAPRLERTQVAMLVVADDGGDGFLSPGEAGEVRMQLKNTGNHVAVDVQAEVINTDPRVVFTSTRTSFGDIAPDGRPITPNLTFSLQVLDTISDEFTLVFAVRVTDRNGYTVTLVQTIDIAYYTVDYCGDLPFSQTRPAGWLTDSIWEYGTPRTVACGGVASGPSNGPSGGNVFGTNLLGCYPNSMTSTQYLTTPELDFSKYGSVQALVSFWLAIESASYDDANIQASYDGGANWETVWEHTGSSVNPSRWSILTLDLPGAAQNARVKLRFGLGPTDSTVSYAGFYVGAIRFCGKVGSDFFLTPTPTETPEPTATPTQVETDTPTPTPTSTPEPRWLTLEATYASAQSLDLSAQVTNLGSTPLAATLYVAVEIAGSFFFHPTYTTNPTPAATYNLQALETTGTVALLNLPLQDPISPPVQVTWYGAIVDNTGNLVGELEQVPMTLD